MRLAISLELQPESGHLLAARLSLCSLYLMKNLFLIRKVRSGNGSMQLVLTRNETLVGKLLS